MRITAMAVVLLLTVPVSRAQWIDTVLLTEAGRYQFPYFIFPDSASYFTLSSRIDRLDRPYLYMACMEAGLVTLDISDPSVPVPVDTLWPAELGGLKVTNLEQVDDLLYVCLGGFEGAGQTAGLATVDVSDPMAPVLLDLWSDPAFPNGTAIVKIDGDEAYLGAMEDGVIVLDVVDPSNIGFISSYQPDPSWPGIAGYPPNGRGMAIVGEVLYLAYDAGGLRSIDISDPAALSQIGQYVNPDIPPFTPPACNNVVVVGDRAYCAIDFCGLEVVDITTPAAMTQVNWLNPWNCIGFSWFGSDGHTNELITALNDSLLFVSGADSEVLVYDITDADTPVIKGGHIFPNDSASTWGVDVRGDRAVANYVNNHGLPGQPYDSKYGGVVLFDWQVGFSTALDEGSLEQLILAPNPVDDVLQISTGATAGVARFALVDAMGRTVLEQQLSAEDRRIDVSRLPAGCYIARLSSSTSQVYVARVLVR